MSEIKSAGIKGYVIMGAFIGFLLFLILVIAIYKANQSFVPESPEYYGLLTLLPGNGRA